VAVITAAVCSVAFYLHGRARVLEEIRTRLHDTVGVAALHVDGDAHARIRTAADRDGEDWRAVAAQLTAIQERGTDLAYVYSVRATPDGIRFAVDPSEDPDTPAVGDRYDDAGAALRRVAPALEGVALEDDFYTDQWGTFLSGYAPIRTADGRVDGILAVDVSATQVDAYLARLVWTAVGVFVGTVLLAVALGAFVGRRIARPLVAASATLAEMTAGGRTDLTVRLPVLGADEVALLAGRFNEFAAALQRMLAEVAADAAALARTSGELAGTSETMERDASRMRARSTTVATAFGDASTGVSALAGSTQAAHTGADTAARRSEHVSRDVSRVADGVGDVSRSVTSMAVSLEQMTASLAEVARSAANAATTAGASASQAGRAREEVLRLGEGARGISRIVELIGDVAEQTNLLALNATIEAASAGAAGRGFAVVADEVKTLARQTSAATNDVRALIQSMQAETDHTIEAIQTVAGSIEEMSTLVTNIAAAVEQQSATTAEIARSVATGSQAAERASGDLNAVAGGVREVAGAIREAAHSVSDIASSTRTVASATGAVATDLTEMDGLVARADEAARAVRVRADAIAGIAGAFERRLGQFRLS